MVLSGGGCCPGDGAAQGWCCPSGLLSRSGAIQGVVLSGGRGGGAVRNRKWHHINPSPNCGQTNGSDNCTFLRAVIIKIMDHNYSKTLVSIFDIKGNDLIVLLRCFMSVQNNSNSLLLFKLHLFCLNYLGSFGSFRNFIVEKIKLSQKQNITPDQSRFWFFWSLGRFKFIM